MKASVGVHSDPALVQAVRELALEGYAAPGRPEFETKEHYEWLREAGSRLWLDTGDAGAAESVWAAELEALTTNNTLVNQVVQTGALDGAISYAARKMKQLRPDISEQDLVIELAFLANAKLALGLVAKFGAMVSVELHPDLGDDINGILSFARRYYEINPDHFYVKVPLTPDGFIATRQLSSEGIPVNYTLGFSARQNYLAARFSRPRFVNVFLGRLNQVVEENGLGSAENIGERAGLASNEMLKSLRASDPSLPTEQIAASMRSGKQVLMLAGVDVLTIPPKAAAEYLQMDISQQDVEPLEWRGLPMQLNREKLVETSLLDQLWDVDLGFQAFVEDAVNRGDQVAVGRDLVALSNKHGANLFYSWSDEDRQKIREKGKIPDLSEWPGAPLDDLMSVSALEAFTKDQMELDARIRELAAG